MTIIYVWKWDSVLRPSWPATHKCAKSKGSESCLISNNDMTLIKWERTWIAWYGRNEGGGGFVKEHEEHEPAYSDSSHCMQAEAGYRAHPKWDLPIGCSSEYSQSNQLMILKTTDLPRLLAELQATACQKQCYAEIFQHFQQLAQCFSPLWFC